jgi:hypothetical protein
MLCEGKVADAAGIGSDGRRDMPTVSARFIQSIVRSANLSRAIANFGIRLDGVRIAGKLDLSQSVVSVPICVANSVFEDDVIFFGASVAHNVFFKGTDFKGLIDFRRARVDGTLSFGAYPGEDPCYSTGSFRSRPRRVGIGEMDLTGIRLGGNLDMQYVDVARTLDANSARIGGRFMFRFSSAPELVLYSSEVGAQVVLVNSMLGRAPDNEAGQPVLSMYSSSAAQGVLLVRTALHGRAMMEGLKVRGDLVLLGSRLGAVDLSAAVIEKNLQLGAATPIPEELLDEPEPSKKQNTITDIAWSGPLILHGTSIGTIEAECEAWPQSVDFQGLAYRNFAAWSHTKREKPACPTDVTSTTREATENKTFRDTPPEWFVGWLDRQVQAGGRAYFPPSYAQLETYLKSTGQEDKIPQVGLAKRWRELKESFARNDLFAALGWALFIAFVGGGYYLHWSLFWALGIVVFGALLIRFAYGRLYDRLTMGEALIVSFDNFVPFIKLGDKAVALEFRGGLRRYMYAHRLAGYVIGSFVVAAIASITKQ